MRISDWSSDVCSSDLLYSTLCAERLAQVLPLGTEGSVKLLSGLAVEWPSVALYLAAKALNAHLQLHGLKRDTLVHEVAIERQVHPAVLNHVGVHGRGPFVPNERGDLRGRKVREDGRGAGRGREGRKGEYVVGDEE